MFGMHRDMWFTKKLGEWPDKVAYDEFINDLLNSERTPTSRTCTLLHNTTERELRSWLFSIQWQTRILKQGTLHKNPISGPSVVLVLEGCLGMVARISGLSENDPQLACYCGLLPKFSTVGELGWYVSRSGEERSRMLVDVFVCSEEAWILEIPYSDFSSSMADHYDVLFGVGLVVAKKLRKYHFLRQQLSTLGSKRRVCATMLRIAAKHSTHLTDRGGTELVIPLQITRRFLYGLSEVRGMKDENSLKKYLNVYEKRAFYFSDIDTSVPPPAVLLDNLIPPDIYRALEDHIVNPAITPFDGWREAARLAAWSMIADELRPERESNAIASLRVAGDTVELWENHLKDVQRGRPRA
jgi:hypothetical protein